MDLQSLGVYVYLSLSGCVCVCVCMAVCVVQCLHVHVCAVLVEGKMQPSKTLLLKLKHDPDIIFVQYLWIVGAQAKGKNLIYKATEEWNLKLLQGQWIGKWHCVVWALAFIWALFDCNVNNYQAENAPACPQSLCFAKAKSPVYSFCSDSRLFLFFFLVTHQEKNCHDDDDHHIIKTQWMLFLCWLYLFVVYLFYCFAPKL